MKIPNRHRPLKPGASKRKGLQYSQAGGPLVEVDALNRHSKVITLVFSGSLCSTIVGGVLSYHRKSISFSLDQVPRDRIGIGRAGRYRNG